MQEISNVSDARVVRAKEFLQDMTKWRESCSDPKNFFSDKLWFDMQAMVLGLQGVVRIKTKHFPGTVLKPVILNQDILENIFCQVRGSSGQNDNPNYYLYGGLMPSINMGQTVISKKGNTGGDKNYLPHASLPNLHPFFRKKMQQKNQFQFRGKSEGRHVFLKFFI